MGKLLSLLIIFLITLGSTTGYLFLSEQIIEGTKKIAAGEKQIQQGELALARGKARLSNGEEQLSNAKSGYHEMKTASYALIAAAPVTAVIALAGNNMVGSKIAAGNQQVAAGKNKVKAGEEKLSEGKQEITRGITRLDQANKARIACGIGAIFFAALLIVLACRWRKSLVNVFKRNQ
jgi:uncharacterized phage infection (PIP) family protein YhgE